jgi:hypothetical protein
VLAVAVILSPLRNPAMSKKSKDHSLQKQQQQQPGLNVTANVIKVKEALGELEDRELERLVKKTPWLTKSNYMNNEEMREIQGAIALKLGRPVQLSLYNEEQQREQMLDAKRYDVPLLYREIKERCSLSKPVPWIHRYKKGDTEYKALFGWQKFTDVTEPFIAPIYYSITNPSAIITSKNDPRVAVQNLLIASYNHRCSVTVLALFEPLERMLDGSLMKVILHQEMAMLFFEWIDPEPYIFALYFEVSFEEDRVKRALKRHVVSLSRKDVIESEEAEERELAMREKDDDDPVVESDTEEREKKEFALFDSEEEDDNNNQELHYVTTEGKEHERSLNYLKKAFQEALLAYCGSGYIKRDASTFY